MIEAGEDIRQEIKDLIDSNEWWVLVDSGRSDLPRIIKERYYSNGAAGDFSMRIGPDLAYRPVAFFIMSKSRMSAADLAECVKDAGGERLPSASYERRPFLFSPKNDSPTALVNAFYDWLRSS